MTLKIGKKRLFTFIGREYILAFLVAFVFFFFIFFINQILILAKRILLGNVDFFTMLHLVVLAIPQFLLYVFPFASLSGAAMVIGDLNSSNEILALRSSGFSLYDIFKPIIIISILISVFCFLVADILLPYSALQYQKLYVQLLTKTPGVELKSYSTNVFDNLLITNGEVKDNKIEDVTIINSYDDNSYLIQSKMGTLNLLDVNNLIYSLDVESPTIIFTNTKEPNIWDMAKAKEAKFFIDFSNNLARVSASIPSNLSSVDLISKIKRSKPILLSNKENKFEDRSSVILNLAKNFEINNAMDNLVANEFVEGYNNFPTIEINHIDFYLQYYRAELYKKMALSAACFFLILITIPLSYLKFKHGRLVGFSLSMFVAVIYWYLLFIAQLKTFQYPLNPIFLMWFPNILILLISSILIKVWRN